MENLVFVTATWARNEEEKTRILESVRALSLFNLPIVIGDRIDARIPLADDLRKISNVSVIERRRSLYAQRADAYREAARVGKNIFWIESDKKDFIEKELRNVLATADFEDAILLPYPDKNSFQKYPQFQITIEDCINSLINEFIPVNKHFTYGPMLFPSSIVRFLDKTNNEFGWGINIFLAIIGYAKKISIKYIPIAVSHDKDVQVGEELKRFRLEQIKDYIIAIQEASKIVESF